MGKLKTIPFQKMLKTLDDLGYKFSSNKEQEFFIRHRCQLQQTEKNGRPIHVLYVDRVPVGMYS